MLRNLFDKVIGIIPRKISKVFLFAVAFALFVFIHQSSLAFAKERTYIKPNLNVPIPGLNFDNHPVAYNGDVLSIPFLAAYISVFFKYMVGAGLIATALMIVYGGFLYLLGSTGMQVQDAKEKIKDAVIGLTILLGAYLILYNINPNTLTLRSLEIKEVATSEDLYNVTAKATGSTGPMGIGAGDTRLPSEVDPEASRVKPVVSGKCRAIMAVEKDKLYSHVISQVRGQEFGNRIRQVAEILRDCHINLGHCGMVAEKAWRLAGAGSEECAIKITPENKKKCSLFKMFGAAPKLTEISTSGLVCDNKACAAKPECKKTKGEAITFVRNEMAGQNPGYPGSLKELLKPGDWLYFYSANSECNGLHSVVFLGWHESKPGIAWCFEGSVKDLPAIKQRCLGNGCGSWSGGAYPVIRIHRPRDIRPNQYQ
ncbi:MAG: hypothetical protein ACOYUZ_03120 [Patescibacteria group bacterium]